MVWVICGLAQIISLIPTRYGHIDTILFIIYAIPLCKPGVLKSFAQKHIKHWVVFQNLYYLLTQFTSELSIIKIDNFDVYK